MSGFRATGRAGKPLPVSEQTWTGSCLLLPPQRNTRTYHLVSSVVHRKAKQFFAGFTKRKYYPLIARTKLNEQILWRQPSGTGNFRAKFVLISSHCGRSVHVNRVSHVILANALQNEKQKSCILLSWLSGTPCTGTQQNRSDKMHR
jgi:hypothetical protein